MILCAFSLPSTIAIETIKTISVPVLFVYPLGVLALCLITLYFQNAVQTKTMLAEIEIRFSAVFNQAPIGIAIANKTKHILSTRNWKKLSADQKMISTKWAGKRLPIRMIFMKMNISFPNCLQERSCHIRCEKGILNRMGPSFGYIL